MKKVLAVIAIALLSTAAIAHDEHFADNEDMYGTALTDHGPGGKGGLEAQKGEGDLYGSHIANPEDVKINMDAKVDVYDAQYAQEHFDPDGNQARHIGK
jgi:hypothetical protein